MIRRPAKTMNPATAIATAESICSAPVSLTSDQTDEDPDRGERVGAEMRGVPGERRRVGACAPAGGGRRDAGVGQRRERDHGDADAELLHPAPVDEAADDS